MNLKKLIYITLGISSSFLLGCVAPPDYSDTIVLTEDAKRVSYVFEEDVSTCEKLDAILTGGAKARKIDNAVNLAMIDARNQAVPYEGNRLVYIETQYTGFFGTAYVGIKSDLYSCPETDIQASKEINTYAKAQAEAQKQAAQAAANAASLAAMQAAQMQAIQAAQHQQAIQSAQQSYNRAMGN